jgi:DNA mismatch repair protein MSH6
MILNSSIGVFVHQYSALVIPSNCLWTSLRAVEGLKYEETLEELKAIYPATSDEDASMDEDDPSLNILPSSVSSSIRDLVSEQLPIEVLGSVIWCLRQLKTS